MDRALSKNQRMLFGYLLETGCKKSVAIRILSDVWEPEETIEMLEFCRDNHGKVTEKQFAKAAKEISAKKEKRTIEDVWNIKDSYKFLNAINLYLSIKCGYGDRLEKLNNKEKTFFLVQVFDEYILNESFTGFFFNSCGDFANDVVPALEKVGATEFAEICKKAFSIYGNKVPLDREEREEVYNSMDESAWELVSDCQQNLSNCDNNLSELCYQYILSNKDAFSKIK